MEKQELNTVEKPLAIFYGGTNGSGKSSLRLFETRDVKHIDPDEIAHKMDKDSASSTNARAGRESIRQFRECLDNKTPFSLESTLSGISSIRRMQEASNSGFNVELHFVGLKSADLNVQRVSERVKHGGHHIDESAIRRRYDESLNNFYKAAFIADKTIVFDNTLILYSYASINKDTRATLLREETPDWVHNVVKEYNGLLEKNIALESNTFKPDPELQKKLDAVHKEINESNLSEEQKKHVLDRVTANAIKSLERDSDRIIKSVKVEPKRELSKSSDKDIKR